MALVDSINQLQEVIIRFEDFFDEYLDKKTSQINMPGFDPYTLFRCYKDDWSIGITYHKIKSIMIDNGVDNVTTEDTLAFIQYISGMITDVLTYEAFENIFYQDNDSLKQAIIRNKLGDRSHQIEDDYGCVNINKCLYANFEDYLIAEFCFFRNQRKLVKSFSAQYGPLDDCLRFIFKEINGNLLDAQYFENFKEFLYSVDWPYDSDFTFLNQVLRRFDYGKDNIVDFEDFCEYFLSVEAKHIDEYFRNHKVKELENVSALKSVRDKDFERTNTENFNLKTECVSEMGQTVSSMGNGFLNKTDNECSQIGARQNLRNKNMNLYQENLINALKKICNLEKEMEIGKSGVILLLKPPNNNNEDSYNFIDEIYDSLDNFGKGYIIFSEFTRFINQICPNLPQDKIQFLYFLYDRDNDSAIDREELVRFFKPRTDFKKSKKDIKREVINQKDGTAWQIEFKKGSDGIKAGAMNDTLKFKKEMTNALGAMIGIGKDAKKPTKRKPRSIQSILKDKNMKPELLASFIELIANCESEIEDLKQYLYHMNADYIHIYNLFKNKKNLVDQESMGHGFRQLGQSENEADQFFNRFDKWRLLEFGFKDFIKEIQPHFT